MQAKLGALQATGHFHPTPSAHHLTETIQTVWQPMEKTAESGRFPGTESGFSGIHDE